METEEGTRAQRCKGTKAQRNKYAREGGIREKAFRWMPPLSRACPSSLQVARFSGFFPYTTQVDLTGIFPNYGVKIGDF
jgi:hypothetical protein